VVKFSIFSIWNWRRRYNSAVLTRSLWLPCDYQFEAPGLDSFMQFKSTFDSTFYRATLYVSTIFAVVGDCPSIRLSRSCIVSRRLKILSSFFLSTIAPSLSFLTASTGTQFRVEPLQRGAKCTGENLRFLTEIIVYLGNGTR